MAWLHRGRDIEGSLDCNPTATGRLRGRRTPAAASVLAIRRRGSWVEDLGDGCRDRLMGRARAGEVPAPRPGGAPEHESVEAEPSGVAPGENQEQGSDGVHRVDPGRAGEHVDDIERQPGEGGGSGQEPEDQRDADEKLTN